MAKKAKVVKEKSIEDRIWDSANKLRGNLTASEYQNVVLGLVFLKYIGDCFEKRYNELVEEGEGFEEDRDEYTAEHVFWVPQDARWQNIASKAEDAMNIVLKQCEQWAENQDVAQINIMILGCPICCIDF